MKIIWFAFQSIEGLCAVAFILRLAFLLYGEWHDHTMSVKYTDIDYSVFLDASREVAVGRSPYRRTTYRYTPLLAYMLLPSIYVHEIVGKAMFVVCDIVIGVLVYRILRLRGIIKRDAICYTSVWLLHPFSINISTRGNAESVVGCLVLLCLYFVLKKKLVLSAVTYGLAVHFKIYPIVFALAFLILLDEEFDGSKLSKAQTSTCSRLFRLFGWSRLTFSLISASVFFALNTFFYYLYGFEFLYETYLYHFIRTDHRHNFSVYFYDLYLKFNTTSGVGTGLFAFLPQVLALVVVSLKAGRDMPFAMFLLTYVFVTFNKVCTAQYFVWYAPFVPLVLPACRLHLSYGYGVMILTWFAAELHWLYWAYLLEMQGQNTFFQIWIAGIMFFFVNIGIIVAFVRTYEITSCFVRGSLLKLTKQTEK